MTISAPQPSVVHLFTIFRQINAGELRIPAFQREFVWKDRQVLDLLTSVRQQFPIGSVLLWYVERKMLEIASHEVTAFPAVRETFPTSYILDGMQRLSTLYGTFHYQDGAAETFNVYYDLRQKQFIHGRDLDMFTTEAAVPLAALLSPRRMLEHQSRLSSLPDGDKLLDELLDMQSAFQDYMIPIVTIRSTDVDRIVGIFERTNSTGTRLDTVDFMRAITWNRDFDLNTYLDRTREPLLAAGFEVDDETIIKCVGLLLGVPPTSEGLLSLRSRTPQQLQHAFEDFPARFRLVTDFLREEFSIENLAYVPYEGQLLVLFKAIGLGEVVSEEERTKIVRWFWAAGFNESLRGRPDHYVVRAVENWRSLVSGHIRGLEPRLRLSVTDFMSRRLIKGKALSSAFVAMFAANGAKSLLTGEEIPPSVYMSTADLGSFVTVLDSEALREIALEVGPSTRVFPNVVLTNPAEERIAGSPNLVHRLSQLATEGRDDVLRSQFIHPYTVRGLESGDPSDFLWERAEALAAYAQGLVDGGD